MSEKVGRKKSTVESLSDKEERFCREYLVDFNKTQAAIRSGYKLENAGVQGHQVYEKPHIQKRIKENMNRIEELAEISQLRVVLELKKIAFSSIADFNEGWMELKDFSTLSGDQKAALSEIKVTEKTYGEVKDTFVQLKMHDKLGALEKIIKMFGYNEPEKHIVDQTTNIPLMKWVESENE